MGSLFLGLILPLCFQTFGVIVGRIQPVLHSRSLYKCSGATQ